MVMPYASAGWAGWERLGWGGGVVDAKAKAKWIG